MTMNIQRAEQAKQAIAQILKENNQLNKLGLVLLQMAHESGGFTSHVQSTNNNFTGIKFANQEGATKGVLSPEGDYYANFSTPYYWAKSYYHELTKKSNPLGATSIEDFAKRLKDNGYFTASLADYTAALKSWVNTINKKLGISVTFGATLLIAFIVFFSLIIFL